MKTKISNNLTCLILLALGSSVVLAAEISMSKSTPYQADHDIAKKIIDECTTLGSKLASFTKSFASKKDIKINLVDSINTSASGKTLKVEISDAVSAGNAFIGHRKFVEVKGSLWENGKKIGSFRGQRSSGGGAFAGYKGSCSVLGRCVKTLGKDIAAWLENPKERTRIGE